LFGQSIPFAGPAGFTAGVIAGELARVIAKELGGGEQAQRVACQAVHAGTSAVTGWVINAALLDLTGAAAQAGVALAGAEVHNSLYSSLHHPTGFAGFEQALGA
jgi:hypothetical protein